jgi:cellulose synthase/poly-beta-1,6-N-acetylglucosamine synthase-like glycosyltransferase
MKTSVIVPTYKRPDDLERCLMALSRQKEPADEVVVISRWDDRPSVQLLAKFINERTVPGLRVKFVGEPGVVAAYNRGLASAEHDIVMITDDDAAPHPDWVARVKAHFERDPSAGGVGGRDIVHERGAVLTGAQQRVGEISWYGRMVGNHHIGVGEAREVSVLKGVNMAWRRAAIKGLWFDSRLRGAGAQVHCELGFSLAVRKRGWKLVYDPSILVEHFPALRADSDQRYSFNETAFFNASYNLRLIMCENLPPLRRMAFVGYSTLIGNRADPGLMRAVMLGIKGEGFKVPFRKAAIGMRAMHSAWTEAAR